jgi:hypothetical protein
MDFYHFASLNIVICISTRRILRAFVQRIWEIGHLPYLIISKVPYFVTLIIFMYLQRKILSQLNQDKSMVKGIAISKMFKCFKGA